MILREFLMKSRRQLRGFTIVELMIVIGIVGLLVALAIPNFSRYVRKANRGEAHQLLMNWANNQEIWRANNASYAGTGNLPAPIHDKYTFTIANVAANTYTVTATAIAGSDQAYDQQEGTSCTPLTMDQSGARTPAVCW